MRQVETSRTLAFDAPRHARGFFEALVTDNLDIGPAVVRASRGSSSGTNWGCCWPGWRSTRGVPLIGQRVNLRGEPTARTPDRMIVGRIVLNIGRRLPSRLPPTACRMPPAGDLCALSCDMWPSRCDLID